MLFLQQKEDAIILNILKKCILFDSLTDTEIIKFCSDIAAEKTAVKKGGYVLHEGDSADCIGIVLDGMLQIEHSDFNGTRSLIAAVHPSDMFAEAFACAGIAQLPVSVYAAEDSEVLKINYNRLIRSEGYPALIKNLLMVSAQKNLLLSRKIEILSQRTIRDKLLTYLHLQARQQGRKEFDIPFDRQALADYICTDRSALSAQISRLCSDGIIKCSKNHFELL